MTILIIVLSVMIGTVLVLYINLGIATLKEIYAVKKYVLPTGRLNEDIFIVQDKVNNVYFIQSRSGFIAIDSGQHFRLMKRGLKEVGINHEEVVAVLLTHSDRDHAGAIGLFTDSDVYMSSEEEKLVLGVYKRTFGRFNLSIPRFNIVKHSWNTVEDQENLVIDGIDIRCLWTPGHTKGSMCFLVDDKYLFTGDTISVIEGIAKPYVPLFTEDTFSNRKSLEDLSSEVKKGNVEWVLTSHYGAFNDAKKLFQLIK